MRASDALELGALVRKRWPGSRHSDESLRQLCEDIAVLDPAVARAAIDALAADGRRDYAPNGLQIVRRAAELVTGAPEWAEVKRELIRRAERIATRQDEAFEWECPAKVCDGSGWVLKATPHQVATLDRRTGEINKRTVPHEVAHHCDCWADRLASQQAIFDMPPLIREFVKAYLTFGEVDRMMEGDSTVEAQAREKWRSFAAREVEDKVLATLGELPGVRRLEDARKSTGAKRSGELRRLTAPPEVV